MTDIFRKYVCISDFGENNDLIEFDVFKGRQAEAMCENEAAAVEPPMAVPSAHENPSEEAADSESAHVEPSGDEVNPSEQLTCLTVQPSRIQCEVRRHLNTWKLHP